MNIKKFWKNTNKLILGIATPLIAISPILLSSSCAQKEKQDISTNVVCDKQLAFTNMSTFKVKNPSPNGFFQIKINDRVFDTETMVPYVQIVEQTNSIFKIQPLGYDKNTNKYTVIYNDGSKNIYEDSWYLNDEVNFTLKIKSDSGYFHKFTPNITVQAIDSSTEQIMNDVEWSYELSGAAATSYLEYFDTTENGGSTKITLSKDDVEEKCFLWVTGTNTTGKSTVKIPILPYTSIIANVEATMEELVPSAYTSFSLKFLKGSYVGKNLEACWNIYSKSGQPLNVCKQDYYQSGIKIYSKGEQVPLSKTTFNIWKNSWILYKKDPTKYKTVDLYGLNSLEFLFGDGTLETLNDQCGIYNDTQTIKDGILKIKLNDNFYVPDYGGILVEGLLYSPNKEYKVANTQLYTIKYSVDSPNLSLYDEKKMSLYNPKYLYDPTHWPAETEATDTIASETEISLIFSPYIEYPKYSFQIATTDTYSGYKGVINKVEGNDQEWTTEQQKLWKLSKDEVGKWLLGDVNDPEETVKPSIEYDTSTQKWVFKAKLKHRLFLPIYDATGIEDETRSIDISVKINVVNTFNGEVITNFPIKVTLLNGNKILNITSSSLYEKQTSDTCYLNMTKVADYLQKNPPKSYQNELYIGNSVYIDSVLSKIVGVEKTAQTSPSVYTELTYGVKHISFQESSNITTFADSCNTGYDPDTSKQTDPGGCFSALRSLRSVTLDNCQNLTYIGSSAFNYIGNESDKYSITTMTLPRRVTYIGSSAFAFSSLHTIKFEINDDQTITTNVEIKKWAFYMCSVLTSVLNSQRIKSVDVWSFAYCYLLSSFNFSKIEIIYREAFYLCDKLTNIDFSENTSSEPIFRTYDSDAASWFSISTSSSCKFNIQFPDATLLRWMNKSGKIQTINWVINTEKPTLSTYGMIVNAIQGAATKTVEICNLSIPYSFYVNLSEISNVQKLNIFNYGYTKYNNSDFELKSCISSSITELILSNSTIDTPYTHINGFITGSAPKLKFLTFDNSTIGTGTCCNMNSYFANTDIMNQILSFTYICPTIGEEEARLNYANKIKNIYFAAHEDTNKYYYKRDAGITPFMFIPRANILTINIKMSYGTKLTDEDLDYSPFQYLKELLYGQTGGILYKSGVGSDSYPTLARRPAAGESDMNTCINWILI